jgi:thiamine biosynthesis lipoprotein
VSTADGFASLTAGAVAPGERESEAGTVRVEQIMGTAISLDLRDLGVSPLAVAAMFDHLRDLDARFSTYRQDSEISRLGRGEVPLDACSPDVREVLERCEALRELSGGYFDIRAHRPAGGLDPSGFVKGWAAEAAAGILDAAGARNYCLNAGGDVITRGEPEPGRSWRVGIRHPELPDKLAVVLETRDLAVATSGAYERGAHIIDPHTGKEPDGLLSFTVVGPKLSVADAYATAAYAMSRDGINWVAGRAGYAGCMITDDRRRIWTEGFARYAATS